MFFLAFNWMQLNKSRLIKFNFKKENQKYNTHISEETQGFILNSSTEKEAFNEPGRQDGINEKYIIDTHYYVFK